MGIRIRSLRLIGIAKNYEVSFLYDGRPRTLSVIAGEISTGKTSVLEFIDYCLGAYDHPRYQEIERKARSAMIEMEANGEIYVIERALFGHERVAWVHHCSLASIDQPHAKSRKPLDPAGDARSLSTFLLDQCSLAGIYLKEAPTKKSSGADPLSFRDLMWLSYLPNKRMDNEELLHEGNFMERIKLQQVISVVFGVYDDQAARLGDQLKNLGERQRALDAEIDSIELFLVEHGVPERQALSARLDGLGAQETAVRAQFHDLDERMRAHSEFADDLRQQYSQHAKASRQAGVVVRDRETLLRRLLPLRGQYAEDARKLVFYGEARRLFDPLRIVSCPACLQRLQTSVSITDGACSLCGQTVLPEDETMDVQSELNAVRRRLRAIDRYIGEVQEAIRKAQGAYREATAVEAVAQSRLDASVADSVAPYVSERDVLVRQVEEVKADIAAAKQSLGWRDGLDQRRLERLRLDEQMDGVKAEIEKAQANRSDRAAVVSDLSTRFQQILEDFGFPKLRDPVPPYLDSGFFPYVRGNLYRHIGSSGGLTLIALAWTLSILELATERGHPHPGFLMIDSPQKNLRPREGEIGDEFRDPVIVERVWKHLLHWSAGPGKNYQLLVVDNAPSREVNSAVVVRYSGRSDSSPYGLIDDETS